ncbi:MAG: outer membrane protein OmpW [SAR86 cluster bacterium]|uniref:Outer membrane protein OmpW n=1 Tax=SAR86 cluster bacterium TaxID=2030880 RepID=A0A2A5ASB3_9GAMM|nr:MAG: outer membrane protein OmpW [SAR86 cluster bacterium]
MKRITTVIATLATPLFLLLPSAVFSHEAGDFILRVGATSVVPDESSGLISTATTGALAGTGAGVGNSTQLGLNFVYMWSDNIGIEVLAATPFEHDLTAKGLGLHGFATTGLGSTDQLPPTLTFNYFFGGADSTIRPYLGLGVNYTAFFSESLSSQAKTELGARSLDVDDSVGVAFRAGVDFNIGDRWILNASLWNIDIDTDVTFNSALGKVKVSAEIDPWVYMISLGYRF